MTTLRAVTFEVGQRVKVTDKALVTVNESFRGQIGTIEQIFPLTEQYPIIVLFDNLPDYRSFEQHELEIAE